MRLLLSCILLLTLLETEAAACRCVPTPQTPCEAAEGAVAFRGRLIEAIPITEAPAPGSPPPPPTGMRFRFHVLEDFSGAGRTSIELVRPGMTSCDATYSVGIEYLVYARKDVSGQLQPESQCGRTRQVEYADADLQYLRKLPHLRTVLAGTLRTRAGVVAGERIVASNASSTVETTTNSEGLFQFFGLPEGKYTLRIANYPELRGLNAEVKDEVCSTVNSVTP